MHAKVRLFQPPCRSKMLTAHPSSAYTRFIQESLQVSIAASKPISPGEEITISCPSFSHPPSPFREPNSLTPSLLRPNPRQNLLGTRPPPQKMGLHLLLPPLHLPPLHHRRLRRPPERNRKAPRPRHPRLPSQQAVPSSAPDETDLASSAKGGALPA